MSTIKLQSSDGDVFDVDLKVACCSSIIKTMFENLGMGDCEEVIPLPNVNSIILEKVITWANHHRDDREPVKRDENDQTRSVEIDWDAEFLNVEQGILFDLILAANYLDIKGLMELTCKNVAKRIQGKSAEEVREAFNIENDLTTAEEEQIRKEIELSRKK